VSFIEWAIPRIKGAFYKADQPCKNAKNIKEHDQEIKEINNSIL
jgi:hypothetical protein